MRGDLYYRLNVLEIQIPPLRQRSEDILLLFKRFIEGMTSNKEADAARLPEALAEVLKEYPWPGNVRELENFAERYVVLWRLLGEGAASEIADAIGKSWRGQQERVLEPMDTGTLEEIERRIVVRVYEKECRNISATAKRLGIDRQTVRKHLGRE